jgi:tetratricopeptide (TPR) repeat protein
MVTATRPSPWLPWWVLAALGVLSAATLSGCGRDDPIRLWEQARADWSAGRLAEAESHLARLASLRPLTTPERVLRAQVARQRGRVDEAVAALGEPSPEATSPEAAVLATARGTLEAHRDHLRAAEAALTRALTLDPNQSEARRELIKLYAAQGRIPEMDEQFRALSRLTSLSFSDLFLWILRRDEDVGPTTVAEALDRALRADPADHASRLALAENLRRLGRLADAESALRPLPDSDVEARVARARLALDRGDNDQAEALLRAASPRYPDSAGGDHPALARLRGRLALARGDAHAAIRDFRRALEEFPDDRDSHFGLGQALRLADQPEAARPHARAAHDRDRLDWLVQNARPPSRRGDPKTLRSLGDACRALGLRDQARAWYRLALSHNPLDTSLQKTLFRLDAGTPEAGHRGP